MKKYIVLVLLTLVLTSCGFSANPAVAYHSTTIEDQADLDFTEYDGTFEDPEVIVNPYGVSPLTALIIFSNEGLNDVELTVTGKDELTTLNTTFAKNSKQYIPVYGLYANSDNEIVLKMGKQTKIINIQTEALPNDFVEATITECEREKLTPGNFYFVSPSMPTYPAAYDINGDVRWYLTDVRTWDIQLNNEGMLVMSTTRIVNPPYYSTGFVCMDYLGKIYKEYSIDGGYHHDFFELANGNYLVCSDDFSLGTVEDVIYEIDGESGKIVRKIDLNKILDNTDSKSYNWTAIDWFHNNSVWYDKNTNSITLSGRHMDSVINIDYDTLKLNFIIGDPSAYSEEYQKYMLTPIGDNFEWQYAQHAAMILPNGDFLIFDNGDYKAKLGQDDKKVVSPNTYSRGVIYKVDQDAMTIEQVYEYGKERGQDYYSPYIGDVDYLGENHYLIHSGGNSKLNGISSDLPAPMTDYDELNSYTTEVQDNEVIFEMVLHNNYYRAEKLNMYDNYYFNITEKGQVIGTFDETKTEASNDVSIRSAVDMNEVYDSYNVDIYKERDRLVVGGTFSTGDEVYIILDNGKEINKYYLRVSSKPYTAMCTDVFNDINVNKYIYNTGLEGTYNIYVEIKGILYNTDSSVTF